jgi:cob(I)alamin adenosyltransferase
MPRITKVYTRTGDDGTTGLGGGQRVGKDTLRIEAYGTVDELNSVLGVALAAGLNETLVEALGSIQNELFHLGSDLCTLEEDKEGPSPDRGASRRRAGEVDGPAAEELSPLENFILPGGAVSPRSCMARTICRRPSGARGARLEETIGPWTVRYSTASPTPSSSWPATRTGAACRTSSGQSGGARRRA